MHLASTQYRASVLTRVCHLQHYRIIASSSVASSSFLSSIPSSASSSAITSGASYRSYDSALTHRITNVLARTASYHSAAATSNAHSRFSSTPSWSFRSPSNLTAAASTSFTSLHLHHQSLSHRSLHTTPSLAHNSTAKPGGAEVRVTFIDSSGTRYPCVGIEGENLLTLAHANGVELEGACEGSIACSTCHVILDEKDYRKLPEPVDEENDMLDLAFELTDTSRLGCQVHLTTELEGMEIHIPSATRNMAVDGHKPKPH